MNLKTNISYSGFQSVKALVWMFSKSIDVKIEELYRGGSIFTWRILLLGIIMGGLIILHPAQSNQNQRTFIQKCKPRPKHLTTAKYEKHKIAYLTHKL